MGSDHTGHWRVVQPGRPVIGLALGTWNGENVALYTLLPVEIRNFKSGVPASPCHTSVTRIFLTIDLRNGEIDQLDGRTVWLSSFLAPANLKNDKR